MEILSQILMAGHLLIPSDLETERKNIKEILGKCGVTLISSDYTVLDHSRIGNSVVSIAKYTLEYEFHRYRKNEKVSLEGIITMENDEQGTRNIWISPRPYTFRPFLDTTNPELSVISGKT